MRGKVVECENCNSMTAYLQRTTMAKQVSFTSPDGWEDRYFAEYACANCREEFHKVLPVHAYVSRDDRMDAMYREDTNFAHDTGGSYYSSGDYGYRGIGFRSSRSSTSPGYKISDNRGASVARNRAKVTAAAKDIKSKKENTKTCDAYSITEIDLELEK